MKLSGPHLVEDELNIPGIAEVTTVDHDEHRLVCCWDNRF
jgi:hypothetical protein